ncbi:MAG: TlpA disulfide reductase family protein [Bacteroidota bacterium]|nr:TlpA disulfide reductase family protein [Bacteroidota bacterium]MDP4211237.1 TlpA disulfide reductase family protein [Bacteroidota bacterium]MDP4250443.1 TlpA disulfide reductase family protein [Bacteroidota bacterium]
MKKILFSTLLTIVIFSACNNGNAGKDRAAKKDASYAIIGKITGQDTGTVYIYHDRTGAKDSARLDHGYFTFKGRSDSAEFCNLHIYKAGDPNNFKGFFLENGRISMLIKKDSLDDAIITGTPIQDEFNQFDNVADTAYQHRHAEIMTQYRAARDKKNKQAADSLDRVYDLQDSLHKVFIADYARTHPGSTVAAYEIYEHFRYNPDAKQMDKLYGMLNDSARSTHYGRKVAELRQRAKATDIGQPAPEFSAPDAEGKPVSLSSYKGRYVLVDFWASWCGPCRAENPAVVKAYKQYHDKGFDILGVSIDESKDDWMAAVKKDGLAWTQVSDLKGWETPATAAYGIQGIPMNFLIDKEGKIIGKELRGDNLIKELQKIFP